MENALIISSCCRINCAALNIGAVALCESAVFIPSVNRDISMNTAALVEANLLAEKAVQAQ